jgi:hypothetical protein
VQSVRIGSVNNACICWPRKSLLVKDTEPFATSKKLVTLLLKFSTGATK